MNQESALPAETSEAREETIIVLAMHGEPPRDFPKDKFSAFFRLQTRLEFGEALGTELQDEFAELDSEMRRWPRTPENDPFYFGSQEMAQYLSRATGYEVILGFNEFCAPHLDDALDQAAARKPEKIIIITPMVTPGGGHSEEDIPALVKRAQKRHPDVPIVYAWPFDPSKTAQFLAEQIDQVNEQMNEGLTRL
jgi:sirohydrochlorin cobaltochelatase